MKVFKTYKEYEDFANSLAKYNTCYNKRICTDKDGKVKCERCFTK